jgi:hypothetical protein
MSRKSRGAPRLTSAFIFAPTLSAIVSMRSDGHALGTDSSIAMERTAIWNENRCRPSRTSSNDSVSPKRRSCSVIPVSLATCCITRRMAVSAAVSARSRHHASMSCVDR